MMPLRIDLTMKNLLAAFFAGALAIGSVSVLAAGSSMKWSTSVNTNKAADAVIDMRPLSTLDNDQVQAARAKATDHWAKMTSEEQSDAIKAARAKKQGELTALDEVAKQGFWARWLGLPWRMPPKPTMPAERPQ
jgi:hypothetical protein